MNRIYKLALLCGATLLLGSSCSNFLDIVPDERPTEKDTYSDRNKGLDYLYSCYAYLPNPGGTTGSLDLLTGDEVITSFEHESFASFPKGKYTASNPGISYWNTFFQGIRQCYMFNDVIDKLPDTSNEEKADYKAQVNFLLAYYHYLLLRCYGPIILVKELPNVNTKVEDYAARTNFDECVSWIAAKFDEAAAGLPATRNDVKSRVGLATSTAAKGFKAKLYLYAASPLFNGGQPSLFESLKDKNGNHLMPMTYDPQKWVRAKEAIKQAIDAAEAAGYTLYMKDDQYKSQNKYPENGIERRLRLNILDWVGSPNPEVIFADSRGVGLYDFQGKSTPKGVDGSEYGYNGVGPTWAMLNRFYTKNGLPWDEDPETKNLDPLEVVTVDAAHAAHAKEGAKTIKFNLEREPRFYAWIGFQGGYFEILNKEPNNPLYPTPSFMPEAGRVLLDFTKNGNQGRKNRNNNYTPSGYLNKKGTFPNQLMAKNGVTVISHPWPLLRLADLYLSYAEACIETGDLAEAKTYIDKIRTRAGIPTIDAAWGSIGVTPDQAKLRQIVRQERQIELYLENQNFWDMRRWLLAKDAFGHKAKGLNIEATSIEEFAKLKEVVFERAFSDANYLLPIPIADINKNGNLINNPGY